MIIENRGAGGEGTDTVWWSCLCSDHIKTAHQWSDTTLLSPAGQWQLPCPLRDDGKVSHFLCRAIAPQLLVSAPLPSLSALSLSPFCLKLDAATDWYLSEILFCPLVLLHAAPMMDLRLCLIVSVCNDWIHCFLTHCFLIFMGCFVTGIPIPMEVITIPSCSSQRCWLVMLHSHPTRHLTWEWHMLWGSTQPITTLLPKRTNSTRCLPGTNPQPDGFLLPPEHHFTNILMLMSVIIQDLFSSVTLSLTSHQEHISIWGVLLLPGGSVPSALEEGQREHTPTLRCCTK